LGWRSAVCAYQHRPFTRADKRPSSGDDWPCGFQYRGRRFLSPGKAAVDDEGHEAGNKPTNDKLDHPFDVVVQAVDLLDKALKLDDNVPPLLASLRVLDVAHPLSPFQIAYALEY
jgi:hypothetical protein